MNADEEKIKRQFTCPKCRGRSCRTDEVMLTHRGSGLLQWMHLSRYLSATCGLCGYTEFYSLAIASQVSERSVARADAVPEIENG